MKEFKDYSSDDTFPINQEQTFTPVFRDFDDNLITRLGVFIAEFLYPPFLIEGVVGKPKVEQKRIVTTFLIGVFMLLSALFGILFGLRWYVLYRQKKRLQQIPLYFGENRSKHNLLRPVPTEFVFNEQERAVLEHAQEEQCQAAVENIAMDENNEHVINLVPIQVTDNVECAMRVACDTEAISSNFVDNKIMPCEASENNETIGSEPVAATERVVRKRFVRQPLERKQVTTNTDPIARKPTVRKPYIPEPVPNKIKVQSSLKNADTKSPARK